MLKTLIIQDIEKTVSPIPFHWIEYIESISELELLKVLYNKLTDCSNTHEISDLIYHINSTSGKSALKYKQNYDAIIKYIAQEFRGKTLDIFNISSGKIVDVFTYEPVEIRIQTGRLDLIFRDETGACFHCEEQRNMKHDDLLRCSVYHFQAARQFGNNMTDILLISGRPYGGEKVVKTKSGTYAPIFIDFTSKDGFIRLREIKEEIKKGDVSNLIELVFVPLYGKDNDIDRKELASAVINYEIDLLKQDQMFEKLIVATLVLCNKILDEKTLTHFYKEFKNMLKILEIAKNDGMQLGMQQGMQQMLLAALEEKLGVVPSRIISQIQSLENRDLLPGLLRQAVKSDSWNTFEKQLKFANS